MAPAEPSEGRPRTDSWTKAIDVAVVILMGIGTGLILALTLVLTYAIMAGV